MKDIYHATQSLGQGPFSMPSKGYRAVNVPYHATFGVFLVAHSQVGKHTAQPCPVPLHCQAAVPLLACGKLVHQLQYGLRRAAFLLLHEAPAVALKS